jgi:putative component of toxin-antitoxin plasmid stabilization module
MCGCSICPTKKQRPGFWLVWRARYLEIHVGAGYRIYYTRTGSTVYVLLAGGVKASQTKEIVKAKKMARELKRAKP